MEDEMLEEGTAEEVGRLKVDLNRATAEELEAIPGIGPKLARRIVEYREVHGAFRSPEGITAVPGVGEVLYERASGWLTVAPPASEMEEKLASVSVGVESQEEAEGAPEKLAPEPGPALPEEAPAAERGEVPAPTPAAAPLERYRRGGPSWIWSALLGGLLGVICTLLILHAINGSLSLRQTPAFLEMAGRTQSLATAVDGLEDAVADLEDRLQVLEGLPARMDAVEDTVGEMGAALRQLNQRADALDERVDGLQQDVEQVQQHALKVETFFQRLQALLVEVFGMELPQPSSE